MGKRTFLSLGLVLLAFAFQAPAGAQGDSDEIKKLLTEFQQEKAGTIGPHFKPDSASFTAFMRRLCASQKKFLVQLGQDTKSFEKDLLLFKAQLALADPGSVPDADFLTNTRVGELQKNLDDFDAKIQGYADCLDQFAGKVQAVENAEGDQKLQPLQDLIRFYQGDFLTSGQGGLEQAFDNKLIQSQNGGSIQNLLDKADLLKFRFEDGPAPGRQTPMDESRNTPIDYRNNLHGDYSAMQVDIVPIRNVAVSAGNPGQIALQEEGISDFEKVSLNFEPPASDFSIGLLGAGYNNEGKFLAGYGARMRLYVFRPGLIPGVAFTNTGGFLVVDVVYADGFSFRKLDLGAELDLGLVQLGCWPFRFDNLTNAYSFSLISLGLTEKVYF